MSLRESAGDTRRDRGPVEGIASDAAHAMSQPSESPTADEAENDDRELLGSLVDRANDGDPAALHRLRVVLDANPPLWRQVADLGQLALEELIDRAADGNRLMSESLERRLGEMRDELGGPRPTPVVSLAVERVLACWLHLQSLELDPQPAESEPSPLATWRLKCLDQAHRRYLSALRMLATLQGRQLVEAVGIGKPTIPSVIGFRERARR